MAKRFGGVSRIALTGMLYPRLWFFASKVVLGTIAAQQSMLFCSERSEPKTHELRVLARFHRVPCGLLLTLTEPLDPDTQRLCERGSATRIRRRTTAKSNDEIK